MKISAKQFEIIEEWLYQNARPLELAKWQVLTGKGSKQALLEVLLSYQNEDGGFGKGLESDITMPNSSAITSAEAIFTAKNFGLLEDADWLRKVLAYFQATMKAIPSFWEKVPATVEAYPHAPWWTYTADTTFSPNPAAVVAAVFILYGNEEQVAIGMDVAARCFEFLLGTDVCSEHDTFCLQFLVMQLSAARPELVTDAVIAALIRRVGENVSFDAEAWSGYVAQPLELAPSADVIGYEIVAPGVEANLDYWIKTLDPQGFWQPNFSWGVETDEAILATNNWRGHMTVRRMAILQAYGRVE